MNAALFPDVVVNGERIPHALVAAEAQNHPAPRDKPGLAWRKAANALAIKALLLQEARARQVRPEPMAVGSGKTETEEEALIRGLLDQVLDPAPVTEGEITTEWSRDPTRFRAPPLWEVSHILIACDPRDPAACAQAEGRARQLAEKVQAEPAAFGRFARESSDCGSGKSGGTLGQIRPGDTVPEFEAVLRRLGKNETTSEPVLTRHGWHVIRMDDHAPGDVLPFDVVRPRIAQAMEKRAWSEAAREFVQSLARKASVSGADLTANLADDGGGA